MATCTMFAQNNDAVLLKVGNESITKGTFLNAYQKNNDLFICTFPFLFWGLFYGSNVTLTCRHGIESFHLYSLFTYGMYLLFH